MPRNTSQSTSALYRAARTLPLLLLAAFAACTSLTPTQRPATTGDTAGLEQRARAAVDAGNLSTAAELYTQLAMGSSGSARIDY